MKKLVFFTLACLLTLSPAWAKLDLEPLGQNQVNLAQLEVKKADFFDFLKKALLAQPPGLGSYGRLEVDLCDLPYQGRALKKWKNEKGREIQYLSNPSCAQAVLRLLLIQNYSFDASALDDYQARQCILHLEKSLSPLLELNSLKIEAKALGCADCDFKARARVDSLAKQQKRLEKSCAAQNPKVQSFLEDLNQASQAVFQEKSRL